jgi:hypothetical protein
MRKAPSASSIVSRGKILLLVACWFFRRYKIIIMPVVLYGCDNWSPHTTETQMEAISEQSASENISAHS